MGIGKRCRAGVKVYIIYVTKLIIIPIIDAI